VRVLAHRPMHGREKNMKQPIQIVFRGLAPSPALDAAARLKAGKLDRACKDLISCRVTIELLDAQVRTGQQYAVAIDLGFPNRALSVHRVRNEDAHAALRQAFEDMRRIVEEAMGGGDKGRGTPPGEGELAPG
jgi:ribosome-associated translation inhibitor RaiA